MMRHAINQVPQPSKQFTVRKRIWGQEVKKEEKWVVSHIKENSVVIGISITPINTIESLGELNIAYTLAN
jgi:hypothetical protein